MTKFEVIVHDDRDNPENNGNVVFGPTTLDRAQGFLDGVAYVNDSALVLKMESVDSEEIDDDREFFFIRGSSTWSRFKEMKRELDTLRKIFDYNGGRGIELADEIDELQARIDVFLHEHKGEV